MGKVKSVASCLPRVGSRSGCWHVKAHLPSQVGLAPPQQVCLALSAIRQRGRTGATRKGPLAVPIPHIYVYCIHIVHLPGPVSAVKPGSG